MGPGAFDSSGAAGGEEEGERDRDEREAFTTARSLRAAFTTARSQGRACDHVSAQSLARVDRAPVVPDSRDGGFGLVGDVGARAARCKIVADRVGAGARFLDAVDREEPAAEVDLRRQSRPRRRSPARCCRRRRFRRSRCPRAVRLRSRSRARRGSSRTRCGSDRRGPRRRRRSAGRGGNGGSWSHASR